MFLDYLNLNFAMILVKIDINLHNMMEESVNTIYYLLELKLPGAVLVFLPGWNLIYSLMKHLEQHPVFGECHK